MIFESEFVRLKLLRVKTQQYSTTQHDKLAYFTMTLQFRKKKLNGARHSTAFILRQKGNYCIYKTVLTSKSTGTKVGSSTIVSAM